MLYDKVHMWDIISHSVLMRYSVLLYDKSYSVLLYDKSYSVLLYDSWFYRVLLSHMTIMLISDIVYCYPICHIEYCYVIAYIVNHVCNEAFDNCPSGRHNHCIMLHQLTIHIQLVITNVYISTCPWQMDISSISI